MNLQIPISHQPKRRAQVCFSVLKQYHPPDMVLLSYNLLEKIISSNPEDVESIDTVSCYGVQMGMSCPLKLLKLTIDFAKQAMMFKELFALPRCAIYGAYIDISINYVFQALRY